MASPHVAGAGALLTQARPDWSPAQMQSALMTTARPTVVDFDGTPATPYEQGAGAVNVGLAAMAGLLFDETLANYMAADPDEGGDPKALNLPSFADTQCLAVCSWTRTASVPDNADGGGARQRHVGGDGRGRRRAGARRLDRHGHGVSGRHDVARGHR